MAEYLLAQTLKLYNSIQLQQFKHEKGLSRKLPVHKFLRKMSFDRQTPVRQRAQELS